MLHLYISVCVCIIMTHIRMCIFVNINIVYPFRHTVIIIRPTANTHTARDDISHVPDRQNAQDSLSYFIICDVYQ